MSSDRTSRRAALAGLAALAGCGFSPALAPGGAAGRLRGQVALETPDTVPGFALRRQLADRLGEGAGPYRLTVALATATEPATIDLAGRTTRVNLVGDAVWTLAREGVVIAQDTASSFTSYSATGTTVATQAASDDAEARLSVLLADRIVADLLLLDLAA